MWLEQAPELWFGSVAVALSLHRATEHIASPRRGVGDTHLSCRDWVMCSCARCRHI